jgi:phenylacetic acid degradation operon negative regulatory protein
VRTGIYRLSESGWFEAKPVGRRSRYRLTDAGLEGFERAFHRVYDAPFMAWNGVWEGVIVGSEFSGAAARRRLRQELAWAGFGRFGPGVHLRPARRDDSLDRIARASQRTAALTAFEARDRTRTALATLRSRTSEIWPLAALAADYRHFIARYGGVALGLHDVDLDPEQAFVLRILLVHAYRRVRLRDPQLPRSVLPKDWPGATAYDLARTLHRATMQGAAQFADAAFEITGEPASRKVGHLRHFGPALRRR